MKKIIYVAIVLLAITSCKKKSEDVILPNPVAQLPKIKTYTIGGDNVTYTYDAQGRILTRVNTVSNWKYEYSYGTNVVTENYYVGTTLSSTYRYELQTDNGLVRRIFSSGDTYQTAYTYNANNLVSEKVNSNTLNSNTTTEKFYYTGNLLDSTIKTFSSNTDKYRTHYTYYTDKINTIGFKNMGYLFYAEESDKPVKQVKYIFSPTNTQISDYTYTYDAAGKIINRKINGGANGNNDITYY
ncbi:MAG: hypothetical protein ABL929_05695 [Ferruginibacter sp.]|nr:hypothetical protein [Ferruginibacter sp.]